MPLTVKKLSIIELQELKSPQEALYTDFYSIVLYSLGFLYEIQIATKNPINIPNPNIQVDFQISLFTTSIPFCIMFSAINPWKINPNPAGITIYGAFKPNANPQATALLSIFNLFITTNNGGIKIGINAI